MKCSKIALFLLFFLALASSLTAQSRKDLESKRKKLIQDIQETTNRLQETQKSKAAAFDRYLTLQRQIGKRKQLIETLQEEIAFTDESINRTNEVVDALSRDIERLRSDYALMIRSAYRQRANKSQLIFLFSAQSINQLFRRWQYLRQYNRYRQKQAELILETQKTLRAKAQQLTERQKEKKLLLTSEESQQLLLDKELDDKNKLVRKLKKNESRLSAELEKQQRDHQKLNGAIEAIIREEMARKRKAARSTEKTEPQSNNAAASNKIDTDPVSISFQQNKGRLPWPVRGEVVRSFGVQAHPTLKGIEITNNGIDIRTNGQAEVQAVFEGKVVGTQFIPGYQNLVILQHGNYYTVYSNLEEVHVRRGEQVSSGQTIGQLSSSKNELHFELWRDKQHQNPQPWLLK